MEPIGIQPWSTQRFNENAELCSSAAVLGGDCYVQWQESYQGHVE